MFTGLIEEVGTVTSLRASAAGTVLRMRAPRLAPEVAEGDSLAVNGICLTVEEIQGEQLGFHLGQETVERSTARRWAVGRRVNLERALAAGGRMGGHIVQGHVDGVGAVTAVRPAGDTIWLGLTFPAEGTPYLVEKGSLAVDGVSLTVARLAGTSLDIQIIPYTWEHTALADLRPGSEVNLEYDVLGKYVVRYMEAREGMAGGGLTEEMLREQGFG
jgi:riboflavin synthase